MLSCSVLESLVSVLGCLSKVWVHYGLAYRRESFLQQRILIMKPNKERKRWHSAHIYGRKQAFRQGGRACLRFRYPLYPCLHVLNEICRLPQNTQRDRSAPKYKSTGTKAYTRKQAKKRLPALQICFVSLSTLYFCATTLMNT